MKKVIGISFNGSKKIYYFLIGNFDLNKGDFVITSTEKGEQFGTVVTDVIDVDEKKLNSELKNIVRIADKKDISTNEKNIKDSASALKKAVSIAEELGLDMQILDASFTFDRKQLLFTFLADERIDFRELVKKLAAIYKTRIELRQIGVRDKSKIVGGYGQCGRELCCSVFLRDLNSVSINMAKNQNLALNPQKINGVCGRLMCCLAYENEDYNVYKKGLPKVGSKYVYNGEEGKVIYVDIFERICKLEMSDSKVVTVDLGK
ncbi:MAG: stage 0 sporulation family protein [Bacilli bacterium]|nr:stage 0 sporulation family protein [Bacilli bacterium]